MKLKLKGSVSFFTPKKLGVIYAVSLIVCVALRIYHVLTLIEPQTGFFKSSDFTVPLFYTVFAVSVIIILFGAYLSENDFNLTAKAVNSDKAVGIISIFMSLAFFLDFGYCFVMALDSEEAYSYSASESFSALMGNGSFPRKVQMFFAFFSFLYFLIFAVMVLAKKYKGQLKIMSLSTVFWGIGRMITLFVKKISFVQVSDLFLEIAATAFMTLFFFSLCECLSGVYREEAQWRIAGVGLPASLCCLVIQVPRIIAGILDNIHADEPGYVLYLYSDDYILNYVEIFVGILALILFIKAEKSKEVPAQE